MSDQWEFSGALLTCGYYVPTNALSEDVPPLLAQDPIKAISKIAPDLEGQLRADFLAIRTRLAKSPETAANVLGLLAKDEGEVVKALLENPCVPPRALRTVWRRIQSANIQTDVWAEGLAEDLAQHPRASLQLLRDMVPLYSRAVAASPACPERLLSELSESDCAATRLAAVKNPSVQPQDLLARVVDADREVAQTAQDRILSCEFNVVYEALLRLKTGPRFALARRASQTQRRRMAGHTDSRLRHAVARTADDPAVLTKLAADPDERVRRAASLRLMDAVSA